MHCYVKFGSQGVTILYPIPWTNEARYNEARLYLNWKVYMFDYLDNIIVYGAWFYPVLDRLKMQTEFVRLISR